MHFTAMRKKSTSSKTSKNRSKIAFFEKRNNKKEQTIVKKGRGAAQSHYAPAGPPETSKRPQLTTVLSIFAIFEAAQKPGCLKWFLSTFAPDAPFHLQKTIQNEGHTPCSDKASPGPLPKPAFWRVRPVHPCKNNTKWTLAV